MKISAPVSEPFAIHMWKHVYRCSACKLQVSKIWNRLDKTQTHLMATVCQCKEAKENKSWVYVYDMQYIYTHSTYQKRKLNRMK